jgi:DNA processing protein
MFLRWQDTQVITVNKEELLYLMAFKKIENVGDKTIDNLYRRFTSLKEALYADDEKLSALKIQKRILTSLLENRKRIDIGDIEHEIEEILSQGVKICSKFDEDYPERLRELTDAPSMVYVKGLIKADENAVAVVGTRNPSTMGRNVARNIAKGLAGADYTVVSGLARGVDTEAHLGALDGMGRTIAVLGTGFNKEVFYPKENFYLFDEIVENRFCISEFPPDSKVLMHRMYRKNRIISVLSKGVLIVEMSNKTHSGTLTQARYAQNQGRKVFVMESIDEVSGGNKGWRILKKEMEPIIVNNYEDIISEIKKPLIKQVDLLRYGAAE